MNVPFFTLAASTASSLDKTNTRKSNLTEKLSSGYQINRANDDAARLCISEKMRAQIRGLTRGSLNTEDAVSLIHTADGAMQEVSDMLNRIRELAIQAANDTNTDDDREKIQYEVDEIKCEITRIGKTTEFNTFKILQGKTLSDRYSEHTLADFSQVPAFDDNPKYSPPGLNMTLGSSKTIDFSHVNGSNKRLLANTGFSFLCSASCSQKFEFKFVNNVPNPTNGNPYGILDLTPNANITSSGSNNSKIFEVGLDSFNNGTELASNIMSFILEINGYVPGQTIETARHHNVGHANYMFQDGGKIIIGGTNDRGLNPDGTPPSSAYGPYFTPLNLANIHDKVPLSLWIQTNANSGQGTNIALPQIDAEELGISNVLVNPRSAAVRAIGSIDSAVNYLNDERSRLGAYENRMLHSISNVDNTAENLQAAESRIRDTDMADTIMLHSKENILEQAAFSILANTNANAQTILQLLS